MRADEFESRRKEVCKVACDVVIRGGRNSPALLPTLLVGGFGEGAVGSSLRLALAIAQNGSKEQHSKLALSGLLVPVSDLLRTALSSGDLYRFSAALALVRFCGPHVVAGTTGGVQSIRDAIRVATNVLTLPINPAASVKQIETQEALKSECISALESLSENAALWSTISTDALPSIVNYLSSSCDPGSNGVSLPESQSAALRAVLEIIKVPSHAVAAAKAGLALSLSRILKNMNALKARQQPVDENMEQLIMQVLHVLVLNKESRRHCDLLQGDIVRSVYSALGNSAAYQPNEPTDYRADVLFYGLEILGCVLSDIESSADTAYVLQSPEAIAFLDAAVAEPHFIRSLCASLVMKTGMKVEAHDSVEDGKKTSFDVPKLYGAPLLFVDEKCAGQNDTRDAALALLFTLSVYACAIDSQKSELFWKFCLLQDLEKTKDRKECIRAASTFSGVFLRLLTDDYKALVPSDSSKQKDYESLTRPLVRYRLLETLKESLEEMTSKSALGHIEVDDYILSLLVAKNVPHICLSVWKDPALLELSYELIKMMVETDPDEVLHLFVESKESIMSLFDLLNLDSSTDAIVSVEEIRRFLASTLEKLSESGLLLDAVEKFGVRSSAISALASACLSEEENVGVEEEELTSNCLASGLMQCLVELCSVGSSNDGDDERKKKIALSQVEAESIARSLGKKICHMVISRFLERARLQQYEIEEDENVLDAPDVSMLCAVAQHDSALQILRSIGGLHALAQVAGEGEISAIVALQKGCVGQPHLLLEADTFVSIMSLLSDESDKYQWMQAKEARDIVETAAFGLLTQLCDGSLKGRKAVASAHNFEGCLNRALQILSDATSESILTSPNESKIADSKEDDPEKEEENAAIISSPTTTEASFQEAVSTDIEVDNEEHLASAFAFLSTLLQISSIRLDLLKNDKFIHASAALATDGKYPYLQLESVKVISRIAPCASRDGILPPDRVGSILQSALGVEQELKNASGQLNINSLHVLATEGIEYIFDSLSEAQQKSVISDIASRYQKLLRAHSIARSSTKGVALKNGGQLAYNLTTVLMLANGNTNLEKCFDLTLLTSLVNTVQWRYDPKTVISEEELCFWDATVTISLQILARILWHDEARIEKSGLKKRGLVEAVLMVARPGKAPRKAIDFPSALSFVDKAGEAAAKLAAKRIITCLGL